MFRRMVDRQLLSVVRSVQPTETREALRHVITGGGKRLRSVVVLASCSAAGSPPHIAVDAAAAVELFHGFTLVHDDIMDNARTRRGKPTIHALWGNARGILAGDVLLGLAYRSLLKLRFDRSPLAARVLTEALLDVCQGQALDMMLETKRNARMKHYFRMIELKTSALLSASARLGGVIGGGTARQVEKLKSYGHHLGRAFQVQDDLLDVVADERLFGKQTGGDIREGKKTVLLLRALQVAEGKDRALLRKISGPTRKRRNPGMDTVARVKSLYSDLGILDDARERVRKETALAVRALRALPENEGTRMLCWIAEKMMTRSS
jgi:geranylgeranyl diphosphate synthase type II